MNNPFKIIDTRLENIEALLLDLKHSPNTRETDISQTLGFEPINVQQLSDLIGWSPSYIYKQTSKGEIPYYKPNGKFLYFKKSEIEQYLLSNRNKTKKEIEAEAIEYVHLSSKERN